MNTEQMQKEWVNQALVERVVQYALAQVRALHGEGLVTKYYREAWLAAVDSERLVWQAVDALAEERRAQEGGDVLQKLCRARVARVRVATARAAVRERIDAAVRANRAVSHGRGGEGRCCREADVV